MVRGPSTDGLGLRYAAPGGGGPEEGKDFGAVVAIVVVGEVVGR